MGGCLSRRTSVSDLAHLYDYDRPSRLQPSPVVLVSGFLGSTLVDLDSGRVVWGEFGSGALMIHKPEVQRRVALPMTGGDTLAEMRDQVVPKEPMVNVDLSIAGKRIKINAYPGNIIGILVGSSKPIEEKGEASERNLHRHARDMGSYESAGLYGVAYDWRRDVSEAVFALDAAVRRAHQEALSRGLDQEAARVDVLAHSTGCLVTRYYLRYGTQPLPDDGSLPDLDWRGAALVRRAILLGPPNGGALSAVKTVAFGDRPIAVLPKFPGPVVGTFPAIYQLMPHTSDNVLVYADDGSPVDLYDGEVWARHGWGLLGPKHDEVLANLMPEVSPAERHTIARRYIELSLARAKQLHRALDVSAAPPDGTTLHLFASDSLETAGHVSIDRATGKPVEIQREPGDGVVTRRSALHDQRRDPHQRERVKSPIVWSSVHFVEGDHLRMTGTPLVGDDLLYLLLQAPM
jgi:hypothetical protein